MATVGNSDRGEPHPPSKSTDGKAIVVERMTHEGIPEICVLYKRVWDSIPDLPAEIGKAWTPTPLEFSSWMEGVTYYIARVDGKLVGAVGCAIENGSCRILRLGVDPSSRRLGVATALTHQALEWTRRNHCQSVWADVLSRFTGASALFLKLGFDECGGFHRHYWNEDVRLFEKLL